VLLAASLVATEWVVLGIAEVAVEEAERLMLEANSSLLAVEVEHKQAAYSEVVVQFVEFVFGLFRSCRRTLHLELVVLHSFHNKAR
jgi:hypothetical protein